MILFMFNLNKIDFKANLCYHKNVKKLNDWNDKEENKDKV